MSGRGTATVRRPGTAVPPPPAPPRKRTLREKFRIGVVVASALVLATTGTAWGLYRDVTAGIVTTDVVVGDSSDGAQNILLVGVDSRTDTKGNPLPDEVLRQLHAGPDTGVLNSDTIIVLHVPDGGGAAAAFSVPRDTYVDIPGYRADKINAAYPAVSALTAEKLVAEGGHSRQDVDAQSRQAGRTALVKSVEELTGLSIDHYAEINLLGFANLTQAVGGVDVCLRNATSDELSGADFAAGTTTLSGANALSFVRQRHGLPQGDLSRIRRQQVFLAAVAKKILSAGTLTDTGKLSALIGVAQTVTGDRLRVGPARVRPAGRRDRGRAAGVRHDPDRGHADDGDGRQRRARGPLAGARLRRADRRGAGAQGRGSRGGGRQGHAPAAGARPADPRRLPVRRGRAQRLARQRARLDGGQPHARSRVHPRGHRERRADGRVGGALHRRRPGRGPAGGRAARRAAGRGERARPWPGT